MKKALLVVVLILVVISTIIAYVCLKDEQPESNNLAESVIGNENIEQSKNQDKKQKYLLGVYDNSEDI